MKKIGVGLARKIIRRVIFCALCGILALGADAARAQNSPGALEYYDRGAAFLDAGDWFAAADSFHEAVRLNPVYGDAWFLLARATYELGEYELALQYLDQAEKYSREKTNILNLKGFVYISLGKLNDAEAAFRGVLSRYPNDVVSRFGLAELNIFYGRVTSAETLYLDALKRDSANRRALLSLALVSRELGKTAAAEQYITQALRYHSGDAEVHYLAAYISALGGRLIDAEKRARTAVQLNPNYDKAYEILALILFRQGRFLEALDICDFRVGRNRNLMSAWYLKAISLQNLGRIEEALQVFEGALVIDPSDEVLRSALEILLRDELPVEDPRRKKWAAFHAAKADEARKTYLASTAHYEYQKALRLDPLNTDARTHYAQMLLDAGEPLRYLTQLDFVTQKTQVPVRIQDSIEAYRSLFSDTLGKKWNVDPFYLDKQQWKIMLFPTHGEVQLIHEDAGKIAVQTAADLFLSNPALAITVPEGGYVDFASSFRAARESGQDYFAVTKFEENERELAFSATIYSARTGTEAGKIRVYRTGNDRFAAALRGFVSEFSALLPQRGKILARSGNAVLIDLGTVDGFANEAAFTIVKKGKLLSLDTGFGLKHAAEDALGAVTITKAEEEIAEGVISNAGFYDRVNVGDELIPVPAEPAAAQAQSAPAAPAENAPRRGLFGSRREEPPSPPAERYLPDGRTTLKPPALAQIISTLR